jgi:hypothetical protein
VDDLFLTRLLRFDPGALVRLRPAGSDRVELWGALPWGVLVTHTAAGSSPDRTVSAKDLLAGVSQPSPRDSEWRFGLPPAAAESVELLPASVVRRVARAAAQTLREATESGVDGKPVGSRKLRDALLDHIAISVTVDRPDTPSHGRVVPIPQRVVQAATRMGLVEAVEMVEVVLAGPWIGLATEHGSVWLRPSGPTLRPR